MERMRITAGMGALEHYPRLARAGADEVFAGFVPPEWLKACGNAVPLNRREVLFYNIQLGSREDLRILASMRQDFGVPVSLTFNALTYPPQTYPLLGELFSELMGLGFRDFILADPGLIYWLRGQGLNFRLHLSGDTGIWNPSALDFWRTLRVDRLIFPRKLLPEQMVGFRAALPDAELEAFAMNERCHFSGAHCLSLHCDEMEAACRLPYRLCGPEGSRELCPPDAEQGIPGADGCALCALPRLRDAGVTHLKLVGRGNHIDCMERDAHLLRRALTVLRETGSEAEFTAAARKELFPGGCGGRCYYPKIKEI